MGIPVETSNMLPLKFWFLVASYIISIEASVAREGKAFSLFNVVTFKNEECMANGANDLRGTCYTTEECQEKGGTASGGCAMGFGTCCLFAVDECGGTARENCTYIRNEDFPQTLTGNPENAMCSFTVRKCDPDVCSLRLDFNTFNIQAGTGGSAVAQDTTAACQDTFTAEVTNNEVAAAFPAICGQNYDICIRQEAGFCCTEYEVCDQAGAFSLSPITMVAMIAAMAKGLTGTNCVNDFIIIDGSSEVCGSPVTFNKYCGDFLSSREMVPTMAAPDVTGTNNIICDCSTPFVVGITTNAAAAGEDQMMAMDLPQSRGVCLYSDSYLDYRNKIEGY